MKNVSFISDESLEASVDVPTWKDSDSPIICSHILANQLSQLLELLHDHAHILSDMPGKTDLIINTVQFF